MNLMPKIKRLLVTLIVFVIHGMIFSQTIAEKKAGVNRGGDLNHEMQKFLIQVNKELRDSNLELQKLYSRVNDLFNQNAPPEAYRDLLIKINEIRENILILENSWREMATQTGNEEAYALWYEPETTLGQLVIDYGSHNFVYLYSPEIGSIKLSVDSNIPIPRSSWNEMLELIMTQNGIGFKQLNPYLRQLYILREDKSGLRLITNKRYELNLMPLDARICFVLTPEPSEARRVFLFLDKFINPNSTVLQMVGRDILIIGQVGEIQDLLKLYDFVSANKGDKEYKVFPIRRVDADEMARILAAIFDQVQEIPKDLLERKGPSIPGTGAAGQGGRPQAGGPPAPRPFSPPPQQQRHSSQVDSDINGLKIIPLSHVAQAIFLVGTKEELKKAEQIIQQVESQVGEAREKTIFWYTTKHSDAEELAEVLQKIYLLMVTTGTGFDKEKRGPDDLPPGFAPPQPVTMEDIAKEVVKQELPNQLYPNPYYYQYYQNSDYLVNPKPVEPRRTKKVEVNKGRDNFIVDPKTGSIAMVVEADILPKIKELIEKLDVPKKMVQIEVLLFERKVSKQDNIGLNLLRIGSCASNTRATCFEFNDPNIIPSGVVQFIFSRMKGALPAYDLIYQFLLTQDEVTINSSPSVIAMNQTPATIAIVDEISINTGIYNVETAKGVTLQQAFTRAQYGTTIDITPNIHMVSEKQYLGEESQNYITLTTDITFDTVQSGANPEQPDVTRRHITNEARVPDGQTVILGGLRRRNTDDAREAIPFIGELPGIGKLFSIQDMTDLTTEMFIFITPTIISDPVEDYERIKCEEMLRRPGDIPDFLCRLNAAREMEKNRLLAGSMTLLFGLLPDRCISPEYFRPSFCGLSEYDGRGGGRCGSYCAPKGGLCSSCP